MRAVSIRCESCGAKLNVDEGAQWVTCDYCHSKLRIQRGPVSGADGADRGGVAQISLRVSAPAPSPKAGRRGGVIAAVVLVGILALSALPILCIAGVGFSPQWEGVGRALVVVDLNKDGVMDPIGRTRRVGTRDQVNIAAIDGKSGKLLWEGAKLGTYIGSYQGKLSAIGTKLLFGSAHGEVRAFTLDGGKALWQVPVGDKVKRFCRPSKAGTVIVETIDGKLQPLRLDSGVRAGAPTRGRCEPLPHDRHDSAAILQPLRFRPRTAGMVGSKAYRLGAKGPVVVTGYARPGSMVPMVARYSDDRSTMLWKTEVPGVDRLGATTGRPKKIAFDAEKLAVVFKVKKFNTPGKVALFSMRDGRRLWETSLPSAMPISAVQVSKNLVLVTTWGRLTAFDPKTGKQLYSYGSSRR